MQESVTTTMPQSNQWSVIWNRAASARRWTFLLVAIGAFSSVIYPHPPFVAFGAIAGTTLKLKRTVLVAISIWLVNQVCGQWYSDFYQSACL